MAFYFPISEYSLSQVLRLDHLFGGTILIATQAKTAVELSAYNLYKKNKVTILNM